MRELEQYEAECHSCGIHWSILDDPENLFTPQHKTCPVCNGLAKYAKRLSKADARHYDKSDPYAPDPAAGRHITLRSLTAAEIETVRAKRDA